MPTLQFKGKNIIWNHHLTIPYHTLEEVTKLDYKADKGEGNLIIEGDNLLALKALLPQYAGKIARIYIDPPYNTGNPELGTWIYNDNVSSPLMKEWLGKEIDRDDLTRHDKWLCMMVPRLKLLRELLEDTGLIFISIDDNEQHNLRNIMDDIFNEENFIAQLTWRGMHTVRNSSKDFNKNTEYILVYAKEKTTLIKPGANVTYLRYPMDKTEKYTLDDNDGKGPYKLDPLSARNYYTPYKYKFKNGVVWVAPEGSYPRYSEETLDDMDKNDEIVFNGEPRAKRYLSRVQEGVPPDTLLPAEYVGFNKDATSMLAELFDGKKVFNQPKPISLIKHLLKIQRKVDENKPFVVLDSFAGSGTTMHAIMELNQKEKNKHKCIMVQMTEATKKEPTKNICKDITRERVKRAIDRYGYKSGFKYLKVGDPIDPVSMLEGKLPTYKQFAKYAYYLCTGGYLKDESKINETTYFVGLHNQQAIYLVYKKDFDELTRMALNLPLAEAIIKAQKGKKSIVYAPACFLDEDYLKENNIEFVGIPYNLFRKNDQQ